MPPLSFNTLKRAILAGSAVEPTEHFFLNLSNFTGGSSITKAQGICTIDQVGTLNPIINVNRSSGVAPLVVVFDAISTQAVAALGSDVFTDIYYSWDFGDGTSGATWTQGTKPGVASKNLAYGPVAAHCYETAGTYTPTLYSFGITSGGVITMKSVTTSITVTAADIVFAANTIYISSTAPPVPGSGGVPLGANVQHVPTWSTLSTLANTYKRILCKRGDTWDVALNASLPTAASGGIIGAYGTGAKPKLNITADTMGIYLYASNDWRIMDFEITSLLSSGANLRGVRAYNGSQNTLLLRCDLSHIQFGIEGDDSHGFYVVDCDVHDMNDLDNGIGMYHHTVYNLAILGSRFSNIPGNHAVRIQGADKAIISNSQFDHPSGHALTVRGMQDAVVGTWTGTWTQFVVISDNVIDGRASISQIPALYVGPVNTANAERCQDVLVERNLMLGATEHSARVGVAHRCTVRNNICVVTDFDYGISVGGNIGTLSVKPDSTYIYNNTIYKPTSLISTRFSGIIVEGGGTAMQAVGTVIRNNLCYAPGNIQDALQTPGVTTGTMICTRNVPGGDFTASNNSSDTQVNSVRPWASSAPVAAIDFTPNGYAIDAGTFVPIVADYFNTQIVGLRDLGAIQA